jgi:membrane associated rhomboid family serine protease
MQLSITLIIIIVTVLISLNGFSKPEFLYKAIFYPFQIKRNKEYFRFLTSGFIHADWMHLIVNMYVLYGFGQYVEVYLSFYFGVMAKLIYVLLYLTAIVVSSLSTFFKQQDNTHYTSLGASGAVSAIVFASILFNPMGKIGLIFIPIGIPGIILGGLYLLYSYFMGQRSSDRINHEAHFYGAVYGMLFMIILKPELIKMFIHQITNAL